jgi:hypothetical protein
MKNTLKVSFLSAAFALVAIGSASADDTQSRHRLAQQWAQGNMTTIGVYAGEQGVGQQVIVVRDPEGQRVITQLGRGQTLPQVARPQ